MTNLHLSTFETLKKENNSFFAIFYDGNAFRKGVIATQPPTGYKKKLCQNVSNKLKVIVKKFEHYSLKFGRVIKNRVNVVESAPLGFIGLKVKSQIPYGYRNSMIFLIDLVKLYKYRLGIN